MNNNNSSLADLIAKISVFQTIELSYRAERNSQMTFLDDLDNQDLDPRDVASEIAEVIIINYPHIQLSIDVEQAVLQTVNVLGGWRTYQIACTPGYGGSVLVDVEDFHKHLLPPTLTPVELQYQVKSLDEIERIVIGKMIFLAG